MRLHSIQNNDSIFRPVLNDVSHVMKELIKGFVFQSRMSKSLVLLFIKQSLIVSAEVNRYRQNSLRIEAGTRGIDVRFGNN